MQNKIRRGVTIVEVLTSIVVAAIGVAGVLVLIPFGIRQAQVGLDQDDSATVANNAAANFEIQGFNRVVRSGDTMLLPWIDAMTNNLIDRDGDIASCYWIDSEAAAPNNQINVTPVNTDFVNGTLAPRGVPYQPRLVRLMDFSAAGALQPISIAASNNLFVTKDDLQFVTDIATDGSEIDDLAAPQQLFDQNATGGEIRRQFNGAISWSAVAVPRRIGEFQAADPRVEGFDFHVLIYRDRIPNTAFPLAVLQEESNDIANGVGNIQLETPIELDNDDWVMLINYDQAGQPQVGFFRVIGADEEQRRITIDGPNFVLRDESNALLPTFALALPNVVNVYRRQLELESASSF